MCGSSRDLEADVRTGSFQEDLYYRLSGVCLRIPPLRQRKEDVPQLMAFFLGRYAEAFRRPVPVLSAPTEQLFRDHSWPGNLRELEAAARAIVAVGDESVAMGGLRSLLVRADNRQNGEKVSLKEASRAASREAEKELILKALTRTRWNRRRAAQELADQLQSFACTNSSRLATANTERPSLCRSRIDGDDMKRTILMLVEIGFLLSGLLAVAQNSAPAKSPPPMPQAASQLLPLT